jgi:hypothetical protein
MDAKSAAELELWQITRAKRGIKADMQTLPPKEFRVP